MEGTKVPNPVTFVADRVKVLWSPASVIVHVIPVAFPDWVISLVVNMPGIIGSEKATVKLIGRMLPDPLGAAVMVTEAEHYREIN
jgi:hypothetical protein